MGLLTAIRGALVSAGRKKPKTDAAAPKVAGPLAMSSIIRPSARERWLLPQLGAITPQYIEMTLRGALAGAHIPQWELFNLMEDTWPRLRKNALELKTAVRNRRPVFEAYREEDEAESSTATERMKLVSAALRGMQPDPTADECAFDEMIGDILDAWFKGVSILEVDWHIAETKGLGKFVAPRAARWASPINYAWDENLRIGLNPSTEPGGGGRLTEFPPDRFIVAKCKTKSGSILGGALLRPLVWWWCAANFSADWLLNLAQIFGLPFRWASYDPTAAPETVSAICNMLANMGSAGWAAFPAGTTMELKTEGMRPGSETPQGDMLDRADKQCDLLVLGQTLTTDTGGMGQGGGSKALGQVHEDVRGNVIEAAARWAASVIQQQLIPSILRLNYGDTEECPTLKLEENEEADLTAMSAWIATLAAAGACKIIPLDWLGKTFGIPKPEAGEETLADAQPQEDPNAGGAEDAEEDTELDAAAARLAEIDDDALFARDVAAIIAGDAPGHPFRGNQYEGAYASLSAEAAEIGKGNAAMDKVISSKGDHLDAMHRPGVGSIDFRWGNSGGGVRHIIEKRNREGQQRQGFEGQRGEDVARLMPEIIAKGKLGPPRADSSGRKREIHHGEHIAIISLDHQRGDKRAWLLSGYKKKGPR